jgi:iron complex outermembrane receptor protein
MNIGTRASCGLRRKSSAVALAVAGILSNAASAQESASTLEEIVVTAERREINLQEIPTSATVLTANALAAQGVDNIIDIQQVAPSVSINTYNRGTFINIRGVGIAQSAPTSVPGVATYIDGVYIAHETFIAQSFYDIASIEVLRGPQGTTTGQNSTGGAIYMRTPAPEIGKFSGYVDVTAAEYNWYRGIAAVNIPLGSMLAVRVAATYDTKDSFTENVGPSPSEPGSGELTAARVAVLLQPFEGLTFDLRGEYFDLDTDYNAVKNRIDMVTTDPFKIDENAISYLRQEGYRISLEGKWDVTSDMQVRAIVSQMDAENIDQADGDRRSSQTDPLPNPPTTGAARVGFTEQSFDTRVAELNLLSTGEGKLQWVVGAFYMDETTPVTVFRDQTSNGGNPVDFITPVATSRIIAEAINESMSGFGQLDVRFTDMFAIDVGVRYSEDSQDYTRTSIPGAPVPSCPFPCTNTAESDEFTGRLAAKVYFAEDTMVYTSLSRGYKAGGVNLDPELTVFAPETNVVGEVGIKSTVADGRLRINGAVFYSDYDGIQLSALTTPPRGGMAVPNTLNGQAKAHGAEIELTGQLGQLGVNFGVAYLNAEFDGAQLFTNPQTNANELVPDGQVLPYSPEFTLSAGVEYQIGLGDMSLTPRLQASYMDEQLSTPYPNAVVPSTSISTTLVPSRVVVDLRATLVVSDNLRLEGFVSNLLDKEYIAVQVQDASSAAGGYIYGAPRQAGMRVKYDF